MATAMRARSLRCAACGDPIGYGSYSISVDWDLPFHSRHSLCVDCSMPTTHRSTTPRCRRCRSTAVADMATALNRGRRLQRVLPRRGIEVPSGLVHVRLGRHLMLRGKPALGSAQRISEGAANRYQITMEKGLGALQFDSVFVHELTHIWAYLNRFPRDCVVDEGVARLTSYWYLGFASDPAAKILRRRISTDPDKIYGVGFRKALAAEQTYGWSAVRQHLLKNGTLP